jgi:UDP-N-acetylmuramoyl-L-alanyl-D-glutamate--2,6-diaminopimelate ligase
LAQHRLAGVGLDVAILTNIRREHLELHGNAKNYREVKQRIFDLLKPTGVAIVNADDPSSQVLLDQLQCPTLTIGVRQPAEVSGQIVESELGEQTVPIRAGNQTAAVRTSLVGNFQLYNFLSAAAAGLALGFDLPLIAKGLEKVRRIPGRMQPVCCGQDFAVFVDISQTPQQLANALHAVRQFTPGRIHCVATQNPYQSAAERTQLGRLLERNADSCVLTANRLGLQLDYEPYHQILDGFKDTKRGYVIPDRLAAIEKVLGSAKRGDTVLISGCGQHPIATVGQEQWQINDYEVCQAWLFDQAHQLADTSPPIFRMDDYRNE